MRRLEYGRLTLLTCPLNARARILSLKVLKRIAGGNALAPGGKTLENAELAALAVLQLVDDDDRERGCNPFLEVRLLEKPPGEVAACVEVGREFGCAQCARQRAPPRDQARYLEVVGTTTRCPNRSFLVRRISEALAASELKSTSHSMSEDAPSTQDNRTEDLRESESASRVSEASGVTSTGGHARGRFRSMTIEELQAKYAEVVGRRSGSENKAYLIWKIREAEKGHIRIGPVEPRARSECAPEIKVLPLRLDAPTLDQIDAAWRTHGLRSRTEFLRLAVGHYLNVLSGNHPPSVAEVTA